MARNREMEMTERELARCALAFLDRTTLQGADVPAFVAVRNWLMEKQTGPMEDQPCPESADTPR